MKLYLTLILVLISLNTFASSNLYQDCLDLAYIEHHEDAKIAQENLLKETQECVLFPLGDRYYQCQFKARKRFEKVTKKIDSKLKLNKKSCLKFPWI